jgi:hypothetical protein
VVLSRATRDGPASPPGGVITVIISFIIYFADSRQ